MNYIEWAEEYELNALRVKSVIDRKKLQLNERALTADARKKLTDDIAAYRRIRWELTDIAERLRRRAEAPAHEA